MLDFIHFKDLDLDNPKSWNNKAILSFDIDWASDAVVSELLQFLSKYNIKCTFFCTHQSPLIDLMRENEKNELGIHPNFNHLFSSLSKKEDPMDILMKMKSIVPEATVLRSHSLTTSASWHDLYLKSGFKYISNYVLFGQKNINPFRHINGLIEVPLYFADDGLIRINDKNIEGFGDLISNFYNSDFVGIRVFDFHPIHFYLNTETIKRYENARSVFNDAPRLKKLINEKIGVKNWLEKLL